MTEQAQTEVSMLTPRLGQGRRLPTPRPVVEVPISELVLDRRAMAVNPGIVSMNLDSIILTPMVYDKLANSAVQAVEMFDLVELAIKTSVATARSNEPNRVVVAASIKLEELVGKFKHFNHADDVDGSHKASLEIAAHALAHSVLLQAWANSMDLGDIGWKVAN